MTTEIDPIREALSLRQIDPDSFEGSSVPMPHGRVFGGQVLAQSLLAAAKTVDDERLPHSVHGYFLRPGDPDEPITFRVERLRDGRSFSARRTHAIQRGAPLLSMISSFQLDQPGLEHTEEPPQVPGPDELSPDHERAIDPRHPMYAFVGHAGALDMRHVEADIFAAAAPEISDVQHVWMRARDPLPDDQTLHRALLAFACDQVMLEPVLRRHHESWSSPGLSMASLDHAMWWHRPVRVDEWLLYAQRSPSAQGGRGLGTAQVFDTSGSLVATIAQEGMVRVPE
jgi:acyl-CoA thioesterase II